MEESPLAQSLNTTYLASENEVYTSLNLPFFKLNKLSSLCLFSYIVCCVTLAVLCWTMSTLSVSLFFFNWGPQN